MVATVKRRDRTQSDIINKDNARLAKLIGDQLAIYLPQPSTIPRHDAIATTVREVKAQAMLGLLQDLIDEIKGLRADLKENLSDSY